MGLRDLPQLWGTQPPALCPWPRCGNVTLPFSQPRKSDGSPASCPPPKLIPTCAIAFINNSAIANYSLSSSLSSSLIPGKQRHFCIDRIVYFSPSFLSFCCSHCFLLMASSTASPDRRDSTVLMPKSGWGVLSPQGQK